MQDIHKSKKKKPNKQQRQERRAHDADIYNKGFTHGFQMGLEQGRQEGAESAKTYATREKLRWAHYGK